MTHCLTHQITHCLTHCITHPITKLDCMTYQDLSICTEEAKQSSYTISHTVAYSSYLLYHLCYLLHSPPFFAITPVALYTTSSSQILSIYPLWLAPHPHSFLPILIIISRHTFHCQP